MRLIWLLCLFFQLCRGYDTSLLGAKVARQSATWVSPRLLKPHSTQLSMKLGSCTVLASTVERIPSSSYKPWHERSKEVTSMAASPSMLFSGAGIMGGCLSGPIVEASIRAVSKLVSSVGIGLFLSQRGILDRGALSSLSKLIYYVFQAFLFVNVSSTLANAGTEAARLAILPIFSLFLIMIGAVAGNIVGRLMGLDMESRDGKEARMCSTFGNSGPLPLLFCESLLDKTLYPSAVAYISFYLLGWSPTFWSIGPSLLGNKKMKKTRDVSTTTELKSNGRTISSRLQNFWENPMLWRIISPPVLGCILGAFFQLCAPLRSLFLVLGAPFSPVLESLRLMGTAYLPAAMLVLAGSLAQPAGTDASAPPLTSAARSNHVLRFLDSLMNMRRKLLTVYLVRFMVMPLVAYGLLRQGSKLGFFGTPATDKLLWFIILLQGCMPPAQNSVVILQMEKDPEGATSMARFLTFAYSLGMVPIAILLSLVSSFVPL